MLRFIIITVFFIGTAQLAKGNGWVVIYKSFNSYLVCEYEQGNYRSNNFVPRKVWDPHYEEPKSLRMQIITAKAIVFHDTSERSGKYLRRELTNYYNN